MSADRLLSVRDLVFARRSRHTRLDCDWSSDVCSADLAGGDALLRRVARAVRTARATLVPPQGVHLRVRVHLDPRVGAQAPLRPADALRLEDPATRREDRKSVV